MSVEENLDIAIIGMAGRFPGANSIDAYWKNLRSGKECISFFSEEELIAAGVSPSLIENKNYVKAAPVLENVGAFDEHFFGYAPREARMMDPQQRILLEQAWHAIEHAGYDASSIEGQVSVFAGSAMNTYLLFSGLLPRFVDAYLPTLIGSDKDFLATRISFKLNLRGPSVTVQSACSTSLVAVHMACQSLLNGESDLALAGGVSVRVPHIAGHLYSKGSVFTPDGHCRPFDAGANGTIFGSGAGVVVLKRAEDAYLDNDTIYGLIKGTAINNDGASKADYTSPSISRQSAAISEALAVAGVDASTISYVEAHGTGTYLGDPIEVAALTAAYRGYTEKTGYCTLGSVKSNIGHLDAAAGMAGLIKTVLAMKHKELPPTLHFNEPNPEIGFDKTPFRVSNTLSSWEPLNGVRRAGISSLGIGGTNAHVILEEAPEVPPGKRKNKSRLFIFSGKTPEAAHQLARTIKDTTDHTSVDQWADIAFTLQTGRQHFENRGYLVGAATRVDDKEHISNVYTNIYTNTENTLTYLLTGQGTQYVNMGWGLYKNEDTFKHWVDRAIEVASPLIGFDLRNLLYPDEVRGTIPDVNLNETRYTQPALFIVAYALGRLWTHWGIPPQRLIGHSIGEYAAACLSGILSLEDAIRIVVERGRLMDSMEPGSMLTIQQPSELVSSYLPPSIEIAAVNSDTFTVVAGSNEAVVHLNTDLDKRGIPYRHLHTSHAFHSSMMDPMLEEFRSIFDGITLKPPTIPIISTVTGKILTDAEATNPAYWVQQIRKPVLFRDAVTTACTLKSPLFLEIGPGNALSMMARQHPALPKKTPIISSLPRPKSTLSAHDKFLDTLGRLWCAGIQVNWQSLYDGEQIKRTATPLYPFKRTHHWYQPTKKDQKPPPSIEKRTTSSKEGRLPEEKWYSIPTWKRATRLSTHSVVAKPEGLFLIFSNGCKWENVLLQTLEKQNIPRVLVKKGTAFEIGFERSVTLDPDQPRHFSRLANHLQELQHPVQFIAHFWACNEKSDNLTLASISEVKSSGFFAALHIVRSLWEAKLLSGKQVRTGFFGSRGLNVLGDESIQPENGLLLGPATVLGNELKQIDSFYVDLPSDISLDANEAGQALLAEYVSSPDYPKIRAYRKGWRWTQDYQSIQIPTYQGLTETSPIKENGVYLITGGTGGIALTIAESIASKVKSTFLLVSRTQFPSENQWDSWLKEAEPSDPSFQKVKAFKKLTDLGSKVHLLQADITDLKAIKGLFKEIAGQYNQIDGVMHTAGVIEDALIYSKEPASAERVLAPKVEGTLLLSQEITRFNPDFFVLFSSINAHLSPAGQIDYVSANRFIEHFALNYGSQTGINTQVISWPGWSETGMLARQLQVSGSGAGPLATAAAHGLNNEEGLHAFYTILQSQESHVIVSPVTFPVVSDASSSAPVQQTEEMLQLKGAPNGNQMQHAKQDNSVEGKLQSIWSEVLEIEPIGLHDNFFDLGGHSLLAVTLYAEIEQNLGSLHVPLSSLLEAPTIAQFSKLIKGRSLDISMDKPDLSSSFVRIQAGKSNPVFCIHGAGGNLLIYRQLARELGPDQTVFGFQSAGLDGVTPMHQSIGEMAERYVSDLINLQPEGPHVLLGYCMGGTIAWEMAQLLKARGYPETRLIMLETYNWHAVAASTATNRLRHLGEKIYFHFRNFTLLDKKGRRAFLKEKRNVLKQRTKIWKGDLINLVNKREKRNGTSGVEENLARVWQTNDKAALTYFPSPFEGEVHHFRAKGEYSLYRTEAMGFDDLAPNLHSHHFPVYPAGMLIDPFVIDLAERIRIILKDH